MALCQEAVSLEAAVADAVPKLVAYISTGAPIVSLSGGETHLPGLRTLIRRQFAMHGVPVGSGAFEAEQAEALCAHAFKDGRN